MLWATTSSAGSGQQKDQTQAYADLMRKNLRTEKQSIVDAAMELEAADKAKFWAVYDKYQKELNGIWDPEAGKHQEVRRKLQQHDRRRSRSTGHHGT